MAVGGGVKTTENKIHWPRRRTCFGNKWNRATEVQKKMLGTSYTTDSPYVRYRYLMCSIDSPDVSTWLRSKCRDDVSACRASTLLEADRYRTTQYIPVPLLFRYKV